jgi:hypothetical protein
MRPRVVWSFLVVLVLASACSMAEPQVAAAKESAEATAPERMVIHNASLRVRADAPEEVIARATQLVREAGGYVAASETTTVDGQVQQIDATLRVPADQLDPVLDALRTEGELLHESRSALDVTAQHTDLVAQLRSKRTLEERLLALLTTASDVEAVLRIETTLTEVRAEIERLEAQQRTMQRDVALATIELSVATPTQHDPASAETVGSRLERAIDDAGRNVIDVLAGLIRALGVLLPLGLLVVAVGSVARVLWIRARRS